MNARNHDAPHLPAFRTLRVLVACYVGISLLTLLVAYALRADASLVNATVWIRGVIVAATALLMVGFVAGTTRGRRGAYLRLRIASAAMVVAIAVLVSIPGLLPGWMRAEQAACGLLVLGVAVVANGRQVRQLFAARPPSAPGRSG